MLVLGRSGPRQRCAIGPHTIELPILSNFLDFWFLCIFVRRRRGRMLVCYPHYRFLQYIGDQPGIRVGFFVSSPFPVFGRAPGSRQPSKRPRSRNKVPRLRTSPVSSQALFRPR